MSEKTWYLSHGKWSQATNLAAAMLGCVLGFIFFFILIFIFRGCIHISCVIHMAAASPSPGKVGTETKVLLYISPMREM